MNETVTVTTRSRNLGVYLETSAIDRWNSDYSHSVLVIADLPARGPVQGGLAAIEEELDLFERIVSGGTEHRIGLYVGGRRVQTMPTVFDDRQEVTGIRSIRDFINYLREHKTATVTLIEHD